MIATEKIKVEKIKKSHLPEVDFNNLPFGNTVSDHMLVSDYVNGEWGPSSIMPFGPISFSPNILALHYGQSIFEGMKAFKMKDGNVSIFRMRKHYDRFCKSMERMCIPVMSYEHFSDALTELVKIDAGWVPTNEGSSLYIRPFVFATEERFGVKESSEYKFIVFTGPVGPYYTKPLKVKVETQYRRAARGGTGFAKCAGNYGGALYPTRLAHNEGFDQVLWTDGSPDYNIEESGAMNIMFLINNIVVTPPLSDSILDGVTRDSIITLAKDLGYKVEERKTSMADLVTGFEKGTLQEAFVVGTAVAVGPIQTISIKGNEYNLPAVKESNVSLKLKQMLMEIRMGVSPDTHNWNTVVK